MTNTYLTGNPLGSSAPKDLHDNASNFDDGLNGPAPSFQDRNRLRRMSWAGFEAQAAAAIQQVGWVFTTPLDYAAGIVISLPNQVFRNGTEYYRAGPSLTLPYTTTGVWGTEGPNFVSVGDAALRSELASISGAEMVGYKRADPGAVMRTVGSVLGQHRTPEDFGVLFDGSDETTKMQAALDSFPANGGALFCVGPVRVSGLDVPDYVSIYGGGAIVLTGTSGDLIQLGTMSKLVDVSVTHAADPTGTLFVKMRGNGGQVKGCVITNYFQAITVGDAYPATLAVNSTISDNNFFSPFVAAGSGGVFLQNYSNVKFLNNVMSGAAYPSLQPDYGLRVHNGDTGFITDNNITNHGIAWLMDVPAGLNNYALRLSGSLFDSAGVRTGATIVDSALLIPAGHIYDLLSVNCWYGLSKNGNGIQLTTMGAGVIDGICFNNPQFVGNAIAGIGVYSTAVRNLQINGGYASANATYGATFSAGVGEFQLNGFKAGNVAGRGGNGRGINVDDGTSNAYMITNCLTRGNTVFNIYDGGTGLNKVVAQNIVA